LFAAEPSRPLPFSLRRTRSPGYPEIGTIGVAQVGYIRLVLEGWGGGRLRGKAS